MRDVCLWGGVGGDSASNYPNSFLKGAKKKMLSVFKQLVHVAVASASLLHFPVSERQMNRNDCFVLLCSRLSQLHKTYISSLPCAIFVSAERGEKGTEALELGIAVLKRRLLYSFPLQGSTLVCSLFSFPEGTIEKDHFYERGF